MMSRTIRSKVLMVSTVLAPAILAGPAAAATYGKAELPVTAGAPATTAQVLATVALVDPSSAEPFCTGTLIAPRVVVTAAHCLVEDEGGQTASNPGSIAVVAGSLVPWEAPAAQRYAVAKVVFHPSYFTDGNPGAGDADGLTNDNDIGLLVLARDVTGVIPAVVADAARVDELLTSGTQVVISGFGITNLATGEAGPLYIAETGYVRRSASEFIAGGPGQPDTCNGDSGGPVYAWDGDVLVLVGATSRAVESATQDCGDGGIYTLVPPFSQWLQSASDGAYNPTVASEPIANTPDEDVVVVDDGTDAQEPEPDAGNSEADDTVGVEAPTDAEPSTTCAAGLRRLSDGSCEDVPAAQTSQTDGPTTSPTTAETSPVGQDQMPLPDGKTLPRTFGCTSGGDAPTGVGTVIVVGMMLAAWSARQRLSRLRRAPRSVRVSPRR